MAMATGQITLVDLTDSINLQGFLSSSVSKQQFLNTAGNSWNPSWTTSVPATITAEMYEVGKADNLVSGSMVQSIEWWYKLGGDARTQITATGGNFELGTTASKSPTLKIKGNIMTSSKPTLMVECIIKYKYNASFPVQEYKLSIDYSLSVQGNTGATGATGSTGITALMSKESVNIPCNQSGGLLVDTAGLATLTTSVLKVYQGSRTLTAVASGPANNQFAISVGTGVGCTGAKVGDDGFKLTAVSADSGSLPITITVKDEKGATQTLTKNFTFIKSKAGVNAKNLTLTSSAQVFTLNDKVTSASPASITLTATPQNLGSSTYTWTYGVNGANPTTSLSGTGATQTITWNAGSFPKGTKSVTYKVVCDGVTATMTIAAVSDGYSPIAMDATTPLGHIFRNNDSSQLEGKMTLFRNGGELTSGVSYQWYMASSGATDDSSLVGNGWKKLTATDATNGLIGASSFTAQTLVIKPAAVLNTQSFLCRATYDGTGYKGIVTLIDLTDPYTVEMYCPAGTTFKNGVGSTTITCKIYQNGSELDTEGTGFNYNWALYDKNGSAVSGKTWTTKTVTILASDITETGTVRVEVSEK